MYMITKTTNKYVCRKVILLVKYICSSSMTHMKREICLHAS